MLSWNDNVLEEEETASFTDTHYRRQNSSFELVESGTITVAE